MFRNSLLLVGMLCFLMSARLEADSFSELMEQSEAMFQSAKKTLTGAVAAFEADSARGAAPAVAVAADTAAIVAADTAVAVGAVVVVPVDTVAAVAVDTAAAPPVPEVVAVPPPPVKKAERPVLPPKPPKFYPICKPTIDMVFVKGGKFKMGCPIENNECTNDERPKHEVKIGDFLIGKYPVTQKQWASVMGVSPAYFDGDDLPVEQVSWNEIQEFIKRLNVMTGKKYRLPTEAEWEYAAQGGAASKGEKFFGHKFLDDIAWYDYNSHGKVQPVGQKKPNELGLHDVAGNVWEWVGDWYGKTYYKEAPVNNPKGPKIGNERVYRGGSFSSDEKHCRATLRNFNKPDYKAISLGFRLASQP